MSGNINERHRSRRSPRNQPETCISSPGDISISTASSIALVALSMVPMLVASSSCPSRPSSRKRPRAQDSIFTHISKHDRPTSKPSPTDGELETLFFRNSTNNKLFSIPNENCSSFDESIGEQMVEEFETMNNISNASLINNMEVTDSDSEYMGCFPNESCMQEDFVRADAEDLVPVTSRDIGLGRKDDNADLAHLLSSTPSVQDMETLLLEGGGITSPCRQSSTRRFTEKEEPTGDDALHAASRLDKKLGYLGRETSRMHNDLDNLLQGYKTTQTQEVGDKRVSSRLSVDMGDVTVLSEMVATLEKQLERMSVRWVARQQSSRHVTKYH